MLFCYFSVFVQFFIELNIFLALSVSVSVYYVEVRTILLSRHGNNLARPVISHDIIHGLIYVPSTPYRGFFGVSTWFSEPHDSVYGTWQSQAVTHPLMSRARRRLTSVIEQISMSERRIPYTFFKASTTVYFTILVISYLLGHLLENVCAGLPRRETRPNMPTTMWSNCFKSYINCINWYGFSDNYFSFLYNGDHWFLIYELSI